MDKLKRTRQSIVEAWPIAKNSFFEWTIAAITLPYYLLYDRNTKSRIIAIAEAEHHEAALKALQKWLSTKNKEAQYVQVASAVAFASAISTLSWTDMSGRHWTGPACWYTSIIFSITAVLAGAQQTMLLESLQQVSVDLVKAHLCQSSKQPNWKYVFAWQSPIMFLSYALVFYIAGLTSYIASPVAQNPVWNDNAKTLLFYAVTSCSAFLIFVVSSRLIHHSIPDNVGQDLLIQQRGDLETLQLAPFIR